MIARLAILVSLAGAQDGGRSRTVTPADGETTTIRVRISEANAHVVTVVALPEAVGHVVSSWDPKDISIEHVDAKLFLKLFSKVEGHLDVVAASGTHYRLYIAPVGAAAEFDSLVTIKRQPQAEKSDTPRKSASGAIELVRAMRLGEISDGISARRVQEPKPIGSKADEHLEFRPLWIYDAPNFRGYVIEFVNHSPSESHRIDVSRFRAQGLVLAASRDIIVAPRARTRLYLVFWKD